MKKVKNRSQESYRETTGYIRRARQGQRNVYMICVALAVIIFFCVLTSIFLYTEIEQFYYYDAIKCNDGDTCCTDNDDENLNLGYKCSNDNATLDCDNLYVVPDDDGEYEFMCEYDDDALPESNNKKINNHRKAANILLIVSGGLFVVMILVYFFL